MAGRTRGRGRWGAVRRESNAKDCRRSRSQRHSRRNFRCDAARVRGIPGSGGDLTARPQGPKPSVSTVNLQPVAIVLAYDRVQRLRDVLYSQVLDEQYRLTEEIVLSLVVHAPEKIV